MSGSFVGTITLTGASHEGGATSVDAKLECTISNHGLGHAWYTLLLVVFGKDPKKHRDEWVRFQLEVMDGVHCAATTIMDAPSQQTH